MKCFRIELVTEHQNKPEKAQKLGKILAKNLNLEFISAKRYSKFDSSYRISLKGVFPEDENPFHHSLKIVSNIVSDWTTHYHPDNEKLELIFNKNEHSRFQEQPYNVIIWGQFVME